MKKFKKVFTLVLALTFVFQSMTVTYGRDELTIEEKAIVLYDLGLLQGLSSTGYVLDLDEEANREEAMKMLGVALNWEIDDLAICAFTDVSDWAIPYVVKAVEMGITNGISTESEENKLFGAQNIVTARQLQTWFDRAVMGAEASWEDNADLDNETGVTIGYIVNTTYEYLKRIPVGDTKSLIETIVNDNDELQQIAIEKGLIESVISSVMIKQQNKIIIKFTENLEEVSAENINNYILYNEDGEMLDDIIYSTKQTYDDEVIVDFKDNLIGEYTLVIHGIKGLNGNIFDAEKEFDVVEPPVIEKIETIDYLEIEITFTGSIDEETAESEEYYRLYDSNGNLVLNAFDDIRFESENTIEIEFEGEYFGEYTLVIEGLKSTSGISVDDEESFLLFD